MRVLMFCPQFAPQIGGSERQAEKLAKVLRQQGVDVTVWTPRLDATSLAEEVLDGLPVHRFELFDLARRFPRLRGIGLINAPWLMLQIIVKLWRPLRTAQVVHCHVGSLQSVSAALAARLAGVPVICKAALADMHSDLGEAARGGFTGRIVARLGKRAFHRWVATTNAVREALLRAGVSPDRITVIPNGVETSVLAVDRRVGVTQRFLYLGRLSTNSERDVPGLIEAFDQLAGERPDVELAIVGGGDLLDATRDLAANAKHAARIRVVGPGEPGPWLAWADAFVLPSRREGLSNALLEAMAAGLPCIANDIPPNREVLAGGRCGRLVPVGDVSALMRTMRAVCRKPMLAAILGGRGRARVEADYEITSVARCYAKEYQQLVLRANP